MKSYVCCVTLLIKSYYNNIVAELIKKEYSVEDPTISTPLNNGNSFCHVLCLYVKHKKNSYEQTYNDIYKILNDNKYFYYSIIVSEGSTNVLLCNSNIIFPSSQDEVITETPKETIH